MPNKGVHKGFNKDIPGGSGGPPDILARLRTGQSLEDVEPRSACLPEPPPMTSKNIEIWGGQMQVELIHARVGLKVTPTPQFAIAQLVRFIGFLTMVTGRRLSPIRNGWEYFTEGVPNAAVVEACLQPVAQLAPFDDREAAADWIPLTFVRDVLERKPEDEELPVAV